MRDQSAKIENTFVLANRASLNVHSIELNKTEKVVLVKVENTGNMPAERITLFLKLVTFGPVHGIETGHPSQEVRASNVREDYGRTKLFKGNLPILLTFYLRSEWTDNDIRNIEKGKDGLSLVGYVQYGDGFSASADKRTEFTLITTPNSELGLPGRPNTVIYWDGRRSKQPNARPPN